LIALLDGCVREVLSGSIILDVCGVGYCVYMPHVATLQKNSKICVHISYRFHAENGPSLYGFHSSVERDLFNLVLTCSGFGPKIALALFEHLSASALVDAIVSQNIKTLSSVSGIGTKKAELLVHTIRDKIMPFVALVSQCGESSIGNILSELSLTLQALGYSRQEVSRACHAIGELQGAGELPFDQIIKKALLLLSATRA